ncbi:MAG TPA: hypothetical protein VK177_19500 [Flavobacteriales bacterium]|nr:hypothetical protein [Flavobacteriales bacterium]
MSKNQYAQLFEIPISETGFSEFENITQTQIQISPPSFRIKSFAILASAAQLCVLDGKCLVGFLHEKEISLTFKCANVPILKKVFADFSLLQNSDDRAETVRNMYKKLIAEQYDHTQEKRVLIDMLTICMKLWPGNLAGRFEYTVNEEHIYLQIFMSWPKQ